VSGQCALALVLAALVDLLPLPDPSGRWPMPMLLVCVLFYWTLVRATEVPGWLLFGLGVAVDAIAGVPPGPSPIALLAARRAARSLRRVLLEQPPFVVWAGFLLVAVLYQMVRWSLTSLALGAILPVRSLLLELLASLLAYPLAAALLSMGQPKGRRRASRA
jgi:rod shape-determining protein MreD